MENDLDIFPKREEKKKKKKKVEYPTYNDRIFVKNSNVGAKAESFIKVFI